MSGRSFALQDRILESSRRRPQRAECDQEPIWSEVFGIYGRPPKKGHSSLTGPGSALTSASL